MATKTATKSMTTTGYSPTDGEREWESHFPASEHPEYWRDIESRLDASYAAQVEAESARDALQERLDLGDESVTADDLLRASLAVERAGRLAVAAEAPIDWKTARTEQDDYYRRRYGWGKAEHERRTRLKNQRTKLRDMGQSHWRLDQDDRAAIHQKVADASANYAYQFNGLDGAVRRGVMDREAAQAEVDRLATARDEEIAQAKAVHQEAIAKRAAVRQETAQEIAALAAEFENEGLRSR
ncbi:hypothetical protein [Isoptericola sp. NPDC057559]|uniref:hypothetical protein n=1 Tax=Isoptericola sp. NPDC057559 TaxID=3346168 RepID=UPI00369BA95B